MTLSDALLLGLIGFGAQLIDGAAGMGFGLALVLFAGVRERILLARTPKPFQDTAIGLVTAGMLSLTFFAFKGWV
mgnify:CR=1 FL=1